VYASYLPILPLQRNRSYCWHHQRLEQSSGNVIKSQLKIEMLILCSPHRISCDTVKVDVNIAELFVVSYCKDRRTLIRWAMDEYCDLTGILVGWSNLPGCQSRTTDEYLTCKCRVDHIAARDELIPLWLYAGRTPRESRCRWSLCLDMPLRYLKSPYLPPAKAVDLVV
jgi:hypothetical protein